VPGWAYYQVSNLGRVRSLDREVAPRGRAYTMPGVVLRPGADKNGYSLVVLVQSPRRKTMKVHALVLQSFVGPAPIGMQCRHLDGNRTNNTLENLCWGTILENHADKRRHGTMIRGETVGNARLTEATVRSIRARSFGGEKRSQLAKEYAVSENTIRHILFGKTWRHIDDGLTFDRKRAPNPGSYGSGRTGPRYGTVTPKIAQHSLD
jgi:hypothetical protein